ncbi:UMP-CMP kinase 2, mitochondrial-like [Macrosteles quadrilineatus]|uniref:UMP-CMP kinase 2, mitochondrial-like n=1 Tax=Macrosteles quadrilineatus TaxID=74068 RepID=UPI0023E09767|nr:UMP-CMP kinase 2, mitochondrial-like [Macrosteles quadrilineatus]
MLNSQIILCLFVTLLVFISTVDSLCDIAIQNLAKAKGNHSYCVYHSIEEVLNILVPALKQQPPLPEVMQVYHKDPMVMKAVLPLHNRKPFIVLEGVQGSRKNLLAKRLAEAINGTYLKNPPRVMERLYAYLDDHCPQVSSAFMAIGNYIVAEQAKKLLPYMPVVLDKYWHGVTAFNLAKAAQDKGLDLPPASSLVYYWPEDLLMPDMAFYIIVSEDILRFRFHQAPKRVYPKDFRDSIHKALMRMRYPKLWRVNGNVNVMNVENQIALRVYKEFASPIYGDEKLALTA